MHQLRILADLQTSMTPMSEKSEITNVCIIMGQKRLVDILLLLIKMQEATKTEIMEFQTTTYNVHKTTAYRTIKRLEKLQLVKKKPTEEDEWKYTVPREIKRTLLQLLRLQGLVTVTTTPIEIQQVYHGTKITYTVKKTRGTGTTRKKILLEPEG